MTINDFSSYFDGVRWSGNSKFQARCPCHDDKQASLSVCIGDKGGIILNCFAGCDTQAILDKLGLSFSDISGDREKKPFQRKKVIATYEYTNGTRKVRYEPKSFTWEHKSGNKWESGRGDAPHVLYQAGTPGDPVYLVEGEKDADNVGKNLGLYAVSPENGAGKGSKWLDQYTQELRGQNVVILPDNDGVGREFMQHVADELLPVAQSVKILDLSKVWSDIPEHGDISDLIEQFGSDTVKAMLKTLEAGTDYYTVSSVQPRKAKKASEFGDSTKHFLWYPYLPVGEYTVMMADGGTGKGVLCCGIAAAVSAGKMLPGDEEPRKPGTVLIISAEDDGADFKDRLRKSGADLERCQILDRSDSIGMSIADQYEEFAATVAYYKPALVVLDPWHGFLGADVDISRVNAIRPILQKLALLAKSYDTAIIAVSHVNKRAQGENANNAATGSTDFINAARSAVRIIFDESDPELQRRIIVHTKSNFAVYGRSVIYRINDGGLEWAGFSEITKLTLEAAARNRRSVGEQIAETHRKEATNERLITALMDAAKNTEECGVRFSYNEFKLKYGEDVFGDMQPKRALDAVVPAMEARGIELKTGIQTTRNGGTVKCFFLQKTIETEEE